MKPFANHGTWNGTLLVSMPLGVVTVSAGRLNPTFLRLAQGEGFSPACALIEEMMHFFEDIDANFVEQLQTRSVKITIR